MTRYATFRGREIRHDPTRHVWRYVSDNEPVISDEELSRLTPPASHAGVVGRLFWDADHPSPYVWFDNQTAFERWRREIRRLRPGTRVESEIVNGCHSAESLLRSAQERRTNIASFSAPLEKLTIYRTGGVVTCGECGTTITSDNTNEGGLITLHPCGHSA